MVWFIFAFLTALFEATKDVFSKKSLKDVDEYVVAWSLPFFALPFLLPILLFTGIPPLGERFWRALVIGGTLYAITLILYMKAIKSSDLSITVPMLTFTPLFLLITSPLIVGEFPSIFGLIGILLVVTGSYLLNITKKSHGYFAPFKALLKEKGPRINKKNECDNGHFLWTSDLQREGCKRAISGCNSYGVGRFIYNSILVLLSVRYRLLSGVKTDNW
jgi:uncharacterized membrane protein